MTGFYFLERRNFILEMNDLKIRMTCFNGLIVLEEENDVDKNKTVE